MSPGRWPPSKRKLAVQEEIQWRSIWFLINFLQKAQKRIFKKSKKLRFTWISESRLLNQKQPPSSHSIPWRRKILHYFFCFSTFLKRKKELTVRGLHEDSDISESPVFGAFFPPLILALPVFCSLNSLHPASLWICDGTDSVSPRNTTAHSRNATPSSSIPTLLVHP